ncbi:MAG: hypothetical protein ACR2P0_07340 [Acidimicrobiales bacterium]
MSDRITSSGPVEWFRDLFDGISAGGVYSWVLVGWTVFAIAMVVLDRMGAGLLGRSRPLAQEPPSRARTWRWRRHQAPSNFSRLTTSTIEPEVLRRPAATIPLVAATAVPLALESGLPALPAPQRILPFDTADLDDEALWRATADSLSPVFGYENNRRLATGLPPERYNPLTDRVEHLRRRADGQLFWGSLLPDPTHEAEDE